MVVGWVEAQNYLVKVRERNVVWVNKVCSVI